MAEDRLAELGADLIPEPREMATVDGALTLRRTASVVVPERADPADRFAADDLAAGLLRERDLRVTVRPSAQPGEVAIALRRVQGMAPEEYRLTVSVDGIAIEAASAAGLFWGGQTLMQMVRSQVSGSDLPCVQVHDWPATQLRAVHYDTKHHQGTGEYVRELIRCLARYKVNALVWEWEDKLAYERHPEVGAPGAFTAAEMRELTAFAAKRHVQLIPLVQGLGHVSYILKHPQHRHLREIPDSAWEFCPLNDGSYELLFDLWDEAMEATPGSAYLHIGSDETYELGQGEACGCRQRVEEIGRDGLMQLFLHRAVAHVESRGRRAISWGGEYKPGAAHQPPPGMVYSDSPDPRFLEQSAGAGYSVLAYSPNPGIEPLFLGYLPWVQSSMWRDDSVRVRRGAFADTATACAAAARTAERLDAATDSPGRVLGTITTSWDDSGLHTQMWMPRFICAAEYSWSAGPDLEVWIDRFFRAYFGPASRDLRELFLLMQEAALFYYDTFERRVWHWGAIGKIHLPDLPRQEMEFHPYWRVQYAQLINRARGERQHLERALEIIRRNLPLAVRHRYDLELMESAAALMLHNCDLVLLLGDLEGAVDEAHAANFLERPKALLALQRGREMIAGHLSERGEVCDRLVAVWERTRLEKGLSTREKPFVWAPDRARHFANRTPDMRYLILDEELLGLEGYLERLETYTAEYERHLER